MTKLKLSPSHSTLSPIAAEGRKTQGGAEHNPTNKLVVPH